MSVMPKQLNPSQPHLDRRTAGFPRVVCHWFLGRRDIEIPQGQQIYIYVCFGS